MSFFKSHLLFLFFYLFAGQLVAQQDSYVHYTKNNGLLSMNVYSCTQDTDGFMWFGTEYGLYRYDGKKFYLYTNQDGLPDNEIVQVVADKEGGIWGRTYTRELFCYYKGAIYKKFSKYYKLPAIDNINANEEGGIWAYPNMVSYRKDPTAKCFHLQNLNIKEVVSPLKSQYDSLGERVKTLYVAPNAYVVAIGWENWFVDKQNPDSILKKEPRGNAETSKGYKNFFFLFNDFQYELLYHDSTSTLIVYDKNAEGIFQYKCSRKFPCQLLDVYLHKDKLYISLKNGGYIITDNHLLNVDINKRFLPNIYIGKIYADKEGNFWFTSSTEGIFFLPKIPIQVLGAEEGLKVKQCHSVFVDKNNDVYAGSSLGQMYKKTKNKIDSISYSKMRQNERVIKIQKDDSNRIWFGTDKYVYVSRNGKIDTFGDRRAVKNLLVTKDNRYLYVCSSQNVQKFDLNVFPPPKNGEILLKSVCFGLAEDNTGGIWIGGKDSLYYYKEKKLENVSRKVNSTLLKKTHRLACSKDGTLWIASNIYGLIALKDYKVQVVIKDTTNGITNNSCTALYIDEENNVWLGTRAGLNKVIYQYENGTLKYKVTTFSLSKGFKDDEIHDVFVRNKVVYTATNEGIYVIKDIPTNFNHDIEKTHIWRLLVGNKEIIPKDNYVFPYSVNQITLFFSRLCFDCVDEAVYEYRLLPEQTHWTTINEQNVSFNYLSNGTYQFEVRLRDKPTSVSIFSFMIETPFWKRKIAIFLYILFLLGLVYGILSFYLNSKIQKEREEKNIKHKISELEMKAIKSQMNPHFIFNCIQSIQYYYSVGDSLNANNYISKFAQLIRSTLEISEKPFIPIGEESAYLDTYLMLEEMRFKNLFSYSIDISEEIDKNKQMFPALLLQPYVENAIKHGIRNNPKKKGEIIIRFYVKENRLLCEVEDNGVGRQRALEIKSRSFLPKHDSKGMKLSHNRILLLNEIGDNINIKLDIIDKFNAEKEAAGTLIRISIPLHFEQQDNLSNNYLIHFKHLIKRITHLFIGSTKSK
jgi:uncharacterized membrane protein YciS (DUF1049 family)